MAQVWPFKPRTPWGDAYQWQTDVIRCHSAEQRISLRPDPRRTLNFDHLLRPQQLAAAQEIVRRFDAYTVPDWGQYQAISSIASGSEVSIAVDPCIEWAGSDQALIWKSETETELLQISIDSDGSLITDVAENWTGVYLMPAYDAIAPDRLAVQRITKGFASASIRFDVQHVTEFPENTLYSTYRGLSVVTDCPKLAGGLEETISWPYEIADNDTGLMEPLRTRSLVDATFTMRWRLYTKCAVHTLRRWLQQRRGQQRAFWLPSRNQDLIPVAGILSADTTITVSTLPGVLPLAQDSFDIEIVTSEAVYWRQVTEWELGVESTIILTIDTPLGAVVAAGNVARISFLRCVRFNSDRIEFIHHASAGVEIAAPCIECPVPT